ncbi:MAG: GNAT family N-acetyltransferase [Proteobacteria bacterium]|nr:GNAT family N-acetyltransferase [Pseudomonadota bacterium]
MGIDKKIVSPYNVVEKIDPGMSIFIGTGAAEPRTLVKHLMASNAPNLEDLELIQLVSFGDAVSIKELYSQKFRLKTFYSGWAAREAITAGRVDLIPCRFSKIPRLIKTGRIRIDVVFIQVSPPDKSGYCSLGIAVDVAREAMEKASIIVGEINPRIPETFGDTFVHVSDFHMLINSIDQPIYFPRWTVDKVFNKVASNVASVIDNGSCIAFSIGPLFEALSRHLVQKRNLGIHSPFFTDALMDLMKSGAVTNRNKEMWQGKALTSYALGTPELLSWLNRNPLVEFQGIAKVFDPIIIGSNSRFVAVFHASKVDLSGLIVLNIGKGNVAVGPGEAMDFFNGAEISDGGRNVFALSSRNLKGEPNIRISAGSLHNRFSLRESVDIVVTEYGVAQLKGLTVRERAQAIIEIAHPDDRPKLVAQAKQERLLYQDQIFIPDYVHLYPSQIDRMHTFKNGVAVSFRAIKPSDEEGMRRLFYRFSDEAVYYRYFSNVKTMPHSRMQEYVNIDFSQIMSIVGFVGELGQEHIIAEARFLKNRHNLFAEVAFVVDEKYQGLGIATYMYQMLTDIAKEQGLHGFTADVLSSNVDMMKVLAKGGHRIKANLENGIYEVTIDFNT